MPEHDYGSPLPRTLLKVRRRGALFLACQVGWHSIEAERGHSCQPTWQAKMRRGIAFSAKY